MKRPTIRDVALRAKVSIGTASRVINNHPLVRGDKRERVVKAMQALAYRPNAVAQSMRSRATRAIGCMITDIGHPLVTAMVRAAEQHLRVHGYATIIASSGERPDQELQLLEFFASRQVDGLIAHITRERCQQVISAIHGLGVPVVLFERRLGRDVDGVYMDHGRASYLAAKHLLGLGHRRIALITGAADSYPGRQRRRMLARALEEHDIRFDLQYFRGIRSTAHEGQVATRSLMDLELPPTAIVCGGYEIVGVLGAIRQLGLDVPRDISLVALGETDWTNLVSPAITAASWDSEQSGKLIAELILDRLSGCSRRLTSQIVLPAKFSVRESTAPPAAMTGPRP